MIVHAGLSGNLKPDICPECSSNMTKLENIMANSHEEKCAHENFYEKVLDYENHLRNFGKMGVVCSIYSQSKSQAIIPRNDVHDTRLSPKPYGH